MHTSCAPIKIVAYDNVSILAAFIHSVSTYSLINLHIILHSHSRNLLMNFLFDAAFISRISFYIGNSFALKRNLECNDLYFLIYSVFIKQQAVFFKEKKFVKITADLQFWK